MEISLSILADILGTSKRTIDSWDARGDLDTFKSQSTKNLKIKKYN